MGPAFEADEVTWITPTVAITNFFSAHDPTVVAAHNVRAILCLDRDLAGDPACDRGLDQVEVFHLVDGPNSLALFEQAVNLLQSLIERHGRVLVHCRAGRSRSIAVVAAYLKKTGMETEQALDAVRSKRTAAIAPELLELVEAYEG